MHQLRPEEGTQESDAALLARLRAGEDAAFDQLVLSATPRMLVVARRMLTREEDARDAVQEAFLNAFKALPTFDGRSLLTTWLHRITVNACLMRLRSARRRPERAIGDLLPQFVDDGHQARPSQPWKPSGAAGIEHAELLATVRELIDQLPDQYRTILILRDVEELDTEETAVVLGLTPAAVKTRLHRARQALRELLDPIMTGASPSAAPPKAHSRGAC